MAEELAVVDSEVFDNNTLARSLVTLLSLTSDAVLAFDTVGRIVLANSEAERLFDSSERGLVGLDVRDLFPSFGVDRSERLEASIPFPLDGSTASIVCKRSVGSHVGLSVRCDRLRGKVGLYLLVAFVSDPQAVESKERALLVDELSRANKRLSGTLHIVLQTLDSLDVGTLFARVLGEISDTLDAWATLAYVSENGGYRLRGGMEALGDTKVPTFISSSHPFAKMISHEGRPLRLRVMRPTRDELRQGVLKERRVVEEESLESVLVPIDDLPPFPSFVLCPVWFGGHTIALLLVGWKHEHNVADDDVRLLDAVCEYLSVQLAGAFAALKAQHEDNLESMRTELREKLIQAEHIDDAVIDAVFATVADALDARCIKLACNPHQRTTVAKVADATWQSVPVDVVALLGRKQQSVVDVATVKELVSWLGDFGLPTAGLLVAYATCDDSYRAYLLLHEMEFGPFEDMDITFVRTLVEDVRALGEGEQERTRDKRISQALQWGMRNELQEVEGLAAESYYCSATEEAYVGGDFYDLISLPNRRACIIMGDVSGKGVEAASVSSAVKTALGAYAWEGVGPARMVSLLNDFLLGFSKVETFATMFVGIIDLKAGALTYCSAGHPPALLVCANSQEMLTLGVQSGVVGAFRDMRYVDGEVALNVGDMLMLYTDGTTEARSPDGSFFGEDGLREALLAEVPKGFKGVCERLLSRVESFAGGMLNDDVALVAAKVESRG